MAWESDPEEFSPEATIVPFDPPLPLLRGPVAAAPADEPSAGPFVLAFRDAASWRTAFRMTEFKITEQCEAGARAGCSISVSNKCKPPWWKIMFGAKVEDLTEREQCEEREMSSCLASAKEACIKFAHEKCIPPFQDARIATPQYNWFPQLVFCAPEETTEVGYTELLQPITMDEDVLDSAKLSQGSTNYRAD